MDNSHWSSYRSLRRVRISPNKQSGITTIAQKITLDQILALYLALAELTEWSQNIGSGTCARGQLRHNWTRFAQMLGQRSAHG